MIDPSHIKSQKLVKCLLQTRDNRTSIRFIELENYKLWSYMITHKHGFKITETYLGLWMNEEEFDSRRELMAHYGKVTRLNRIVITVYDDINGFSLAMNRYVLDHETAMMKKVLSSHVREELKASNSFEMRIVRGYGIISRKKLDKAVLGLSSDQIY
ncbi:MAG: hypothetical protein L3J03_00240 [Desulfobacterales bacterium]|nr:hypothetical protein [Desulfobacterales bacterium]